MGVFDSLDGSEDTSDDMPVDEGYTPYTEEFDAEAETKDDNNIEE